MMDREREAAQRDRRENGSPTAVGRRKAGNRQVCARHGAVIHRRAAAQNDKRRQCADDNGIDKHLKNAKHTLFYRLFRIGARHAR